VEEYGITVPENSASTLKGRRFQLKNSDPVSVLKGRGFQPRRNCNKISSRFSG